MNSTGSNGPRIIARSAERDEAVADAHYPEGDEITETFVDVRDPDHVGIHVLVQPEDRISWDYRALRGTAQLDDTDNPFLNPPRGFEAGLQADAVDQILSALPTSPCVFVEGVHGGGKDRVQEALYSRMIEADDEPYITNPEPRDVIRHHADEAPKHVVRSAPAVRRADGGPKHSEASQVIDEFRAAAIGLISFIRLPDGRARDAAEAIRNIVVDKRKDGALDAAGEIVSRLGVIAEETGRLVVLRLNAGETPGPQEAEMLGGLIRVLAGDSSAVRMVVTGLPGAVHSIRDQVTGLAGIEDVELTWKIEACDCEAAVDHVVAMTETSQIPFTRDAAQRLIESSDGIKSLVNEIGARAWDIAEAGSGGMVTLPIVEHAARAVLASQREKYATAIEAFEAGDPSARYVFALHALTQETGEPMHANDVVIAEMIALFPEDYAARDAEAPGSLRAELNKSINRTYLRSEGYTMRSRDGSVGLANPQLGQLITKLVPMAAQTLR
jgi:hypothetical protein